MSCSSNLKNRLYLCLAHHTKIIVCHERQHIQSSPPQITIINKNTMCTVQTQYSHCDKFKTTRLKITVLASWLKTNITSLFTPFLLSLFPPLTPSSVFSSCCSLSPSPLHFQGPFYPPPPSIFRTGSLPLPLHFLWLLSLPLPTPQKGRLCTSGTACYHAGLHAESLTKSRPIKHQMRP